MAGRALPPDLANDCIQQWRVPLDGSFFCSAVNVLLPPPASFRSEADIRHYYLGSQVDPPLPLEDPGLWFPGLTRSGTQTEEPQGLVLCLPPSGGSEDLFTSEGTGRRRAPSPLLEVCRERQWELLAAQYPGRGTRRGEPLVTSAAEMGRRILGAIEKRLKAGLPLVVISHSCGCWIAYELLLEARRRGLVCGVSDSARVLAWFVSAMPSPDIPEAQRPWRRSCGLCEADLQAEARAWGASEALFSGGLWQVYEPILRADYRSVLGADRAGLRTKVHKTGS